MKATAIQAIDSQGSIYLLDAPGRRLVQLSRDGREVARFDLPPDLPPPTAFFVSEGQRILRPQSVIPLSDVTPSRGPVVVNRLLLFINIAVWIYIVSLQRTPGALEAFFDRYAFDWSRFTHDLASGAWTISTFVPLITHMFLHGGWLHIIGNML